MKNLIKLVTLSFATLVLLAGCDKPNQDEKPKANDPIIVGTWKYDNNSALIYELVFESNNKVIAGYYPKNFEVPGCKYSRTYEGTYGFNEKTNKLTFNEDFVQTKEVKGNKNDGYRCETVNVRVNQLLNLNGATSIDVDVAKKEFTGIEMFGMSSITQSVFKKQ